MTYNVFLVIVVVFKHTFTTSLANHRKRSHSKKTYPDYLGKFFLYLNAVVMRYPFKYKQT